MLSKAETEFLRSPESFDSNYRRVLRHRLRNKVEQMKSEITLLKNHGITITENCNGVTEFCNSKQGLNQVAFKESEWTGGDLNPRPPECKSGVHTN